MNTNVALWHLARQARRLPAAERYAVLTNWALLSDTRRSVRAIGAFDRGQPIPNVFLDSAERASEPFEAEPPQVPLSNLTLLIEAAAEAGKLDELLQAALPLEKEEIAGAASLITLILLARRDYATLPDRLAAIAKAQRSGPPPKSAGAAAKRGAACKARVAGVSGRPYRAGDDRGFVPPQPPQPSNAF